MARSARTTVVALLLGVAVSGFSGVAAAVAAAVPGVVAARPAAPMAHAAASHRKVVHRRRRPRPRKAPPRPKPAATSKAVAIAPVDCSDGDLVPTAANVDRVRAATFCLVNQARAAQGLAPLSVDPVLQAAAQSHTADMVGQNYFDHVAPNGLGPLDRVLAAGHVAVDGGLDVAENIATGSGALAAPASTVADWMASPGHRANILGRAYKTAGVGVVAATPALLGAGGGGATYTEDFGSAGPTG